MRLSIRARMLLAMNLLVAAVGVAVGYAGIEVATDQVEQKLVHESAENAARLIGRESLPLDSDALMTKVAQILGAETAASSLDASEVLASSLPDARRAELAGQLAGLSSEARDSARIVLAGESYRVGVAVVRRVSQTLEEHHRRFYLLVPERRVLAAQRQVARRIAVFTIAAVIIATAVAFWLSTSITRPVRELANRMDRLARGEEKVSGTFFALAPPAAGAATEEARPDEDGRAGESKRFLTPFPASELVRLTHSFDELLRRLASARRQLERSARLATLGQLAGSVAHELRNPLSGIKMNARVLADELDRRGEADKSLELIVREIDR
ncbi:MAG: histidine kinase dimerization/phospho-acceptor domain-containing protein, partial [Phycisphaerae bacterium]